MEIDSLLIAHLKEITCFDILLQIPVSHLYYPMHPFDTGMRPNANLFCPFI